jgi:hypothetical protein
VLEENSIGGSVARRGPLLLAAQVSNPRLGVPDQLFQAAGALEDGLPMQVGGLCAVAVMQRLFEQLLLPLLEACHAFQMMRERLLGLRLIAMQAREFIAEFSSRAS